MNDQEAKKWGMFCHLSALVWIPLAFFGLAAPFINLIGPVIIWWLKKDESAFVEAQGKESMNFQISMSLYSIVGFLVFFVLGLISLLVVGRLGGVDLESNQKPELLPGGLELWQNGALILFGIFQLALAIVAAVKANKGEFYRYPLAIRFVK